MVKHQKHIKLVKPHGGLFHHNEFAILGASCGVIQELAAKLSSQLSDYKVGYVDAEHGNEHSQGPFAREYTDKIGDHQLTFDDAHIEFSMRTLFNDTDLTLINGNHFVGAKQIVLINQKKKESLERKLDRLTNVCLFVLDQEETEVHDYLKTEAFAKTPIVSIDDIQAIVQNLKKEIQLATPKVKGLVLAGGKSTRMGHDKGNIVYHDNPQKEHVAELLSEFCEEVYLSKSEDDGYEKLPVIADKFIGLGPYGGILSAFQADPNSSWLVVAIDIPLLDRSTIQRLVDGRNSSKVATCFHNPETGFPEPLITLWEPRAYPHLLKFLAQGYSCPRKVLINSDIIQLQIERAEVLRNANTMEEKKEILNLIND